MIPQYTKYHKIPVLTGKEAEFWDKLSIEEKGVDSRLLMGWAGYSVYADIRRKKYYKKAEEIHFISGTGNNAGDGYVIAWHMLNESDKKIFFWKLSDPKTKDAIYFYELCKKHYEKRNLVIKDLADFLSIKTEKKSIIFDCLFGTGMSRELKSDIQNILSHANRQKAVKIAIDIPSGVYSDGSIFSHEVFRADKTFTFGGYKIGHLISPGILYCGDVKVNPIGFYKTNFENRHLIKRRKLNSLRKPSGNKYTSGVLHILGASKGMEGAAAMSAYAFLKLGGGLAKLFSFSESIKKYLSDYPEVMYNSHDKEELESAFLNDLRKEKNNIVLIGVGLKEELSEKFWRALLDRNDVSLILDGSVFGFLKKHQKMFQNHRLKSLVMTPHLSEAESLLEDKITNIREVAIDISKFYNSHVYLKGAGGLLIINNDEIEEIYLASKHTEFATGGTGDILSGVIANMTARYEEPSVILQQALSVYFYGGVRKDKKNKDFLTASEIIKNIENKIKNEIL
ncbi:MAG: NAD(P)H-hydrate epimerase [Spirochaetia bacterium]|nr:NAD(P)H-hydrate epimerase [Spirochaetia bacterium]